MLHSISEFNQACHHAHTIVYDQMSVCDAHAARPALHCVVNSYLSSTNRLMRHSHQGNQPNKLWGGTETSESWRQSDPAGPYENHEITR
jgi:hypothetical protein